MVNDGGAAATGVRAATWLNTHELPVGFVR
jgi:hypothetical protein